MKRRREILLLLDQVQQVPKVLNYGDKYLTLSLVQGVKDLPMQPFGCNLCVVGGKNWPGVGSSVFLESAVGTELGSACGFLLAFLFLGRKGRASYISYIRPTTNIPLQECELLLTCTLVPRLLELHSIVENSPPPGLITVRACRSRRVSTTLQKITRDNSPRR
jgi:hypothetical protein